MSDEGLRAIERALASAPADLELRRRHARLLQRAGQAERSLAALDLAWRLGADELWDELRAGLDARAVRVADLELRWVPAGPFVMGSDDHDDDAKPAHLVELSGFYLAAGPVTWGGLHGTPAWEPWLAELAVEEADEEYRTDRAEALAVVASLATPTVRSQLPRGVRVGLPSERCWERVQRAALLRRDGANPYGVAPSVGPEWTEDRFGPYLAAQPPVETLASRFVARGVPLPVPAGVFFREMVDGDGSFEVERRSRDDVDPAGRTDGPRAGVWAEPMESGRGLAFRPCVVPGAAP